MIIMVRRGNTGGLLNELNGKMGISAPHNSVPVIKLINEHKPRSHEELERLIEYHHNHDCPCGIKSKGTVHDFGLNLYNAQKEYFNDYLFTLEECVQWEYDLFITNSLKGSLMEDEAIKELEKAIGFCKVYKTDRIIDEEYRIDIELVSPDWKIGVQVKPISYRFTNDNVKSMNNTKNCKYDGEIAYLYYDDDGFVNVDEIEEKARWMKSMKSD